MKKGKFKNWIIKMRIKAKKYPKLEGENMTREHQIGFWDGILYSLDKVEKLVKEAKEDFPLCLTYDNAKSYIEVAPNEWASHLRHSVEKIIDRTIDAKIEWFGEDRN